MFSLLLLSTTAIQAQDPTQDPKEMERRIRELERVQKQLLESLGALGEEVERSEFADVIPRVGESQYGLGPAASKVYSVDSGLSIGGYGEFLFSQLSGDTDVFDAQRFVLYFGYRFDEKWLINTEVELEHGTTDDSSGTTDSEGSVSLELGSIEYLHNPALNFRAGLLLVPMGLVNEMHEPTSFLSANRPWTEQRIIPSTWRALGAGIFGEAAGFAYRAYGITSLDGDDFDSRGLRGGRQKGNRVAADDFAGVGRLDWVEFPSLTLGGSVYFGPTGQDGFKGADPIPRMDTFIWELHSEYQAGPFSLRALYSSASLADTGEFNTNTGENLAKRLQGYYVEGGYELFSGFDWDTDMSMTPYIRYEHLDTQYEMPAGFAKERDQDNDIWTFGLNFKPIDQIVFKADYEDWEHQSDRFNVLMGFVF
jgi:hypothetical protein